MQGYDGNGTSSRDIHHTGASLSQQASLTSASLHCEQFIKYEWHHSKLPINHNNPFGCWVSRDYDKMTRWGGASENGECATGLRERVIVMKTTKIGEKTAVSLLKRNSFR